jgi:hypothetical protein
MGVLARLTVTGVTVFSWHWALARGCSVRSVESVRWWLEMIARTYTKDAKWAAQHALTVDGPSAGGYYTIRLPLDETKTHRGTFAGVEMIRFDMVAMFGSMPRDWWNRHTAIPAAHTSV